VDFWLVLPEFQALAAKQEESAVREEVSAAQWTRLGFGDLLISSDYSPEKIET
jgi:hypothetical protein